MRWLECSFWPQCVHRRHGREKAAARREKNRVWGASPFSSAVTTTVPSPIEPYAVGIACGLVFHLLTVDAFVVLFVFCKNASRSLVNSTCPTRRETTNLCNNGVLQLVWSLYPYTHLYEPLRSFSTDSWLVHQKSRHCAARAGAHMGKILLVFFIQWVLARCLAPLWPRR